MMLSAGMSQIGLHVSAALAICCLVWLTQQDLPALEKKVAQCLMFPVRPPRALTAHQGYFLESFHSLPIASSRWSLHRLDG